MRTFLSRSTSRRRCWSPWYRLFGAWIAFSAGSRGDDWPMLGRDQTRNPVSPEKGAPVEWDIKTGRNIKWTAKLGGIVMASPVVANGLVWIGTNNDPPSYPGLKEDAPLLKCFRESDGKLLWQYAALPTNGLPRAGGLMGYHSSPLIEGNRAWMTTRYSQVHCLDLSPLRQEASPPTPLWTLDMYRSLDVHAFYSVMSGGETCSIGASYRDRIYVITGNGIVGWSAEDHKEFFRVRSPGAPSLLCLDRNSGKVLWRDNSPGTNILHGQWGSPLAAEIAGRGQVVAPLGDGWIRGFDALSGELLWKLNINSNSVPRRQLPNHFLNAPVLYQERIYIGGGHDMEYGEGPGRFFCIDPTRRGDLSLDLADSPGSDRSNPNSGVVWHFDSLGRTMAQAAIQDDLVIAAGFNGFIHCLDARTGKAYWQHDLRAHVLGSPLIVDRKIYVGDEDGEVFIFELAREKKLLAKQTFGAPVWSSPIFANGVLYIAEHGTFYAIQQGASSPAPK